MNSKYRGLFFVFFDGDLFWCCRRSTSLASFIIQVHRTTPDKEEYDEAQESDDWGYSYEDDFRIWTNIYKKVMCRPTDISRLKCGVQQAVLFGLTHYNLLTNRTCHSWQKTDGFVQWDAKGGCEEGSVCVCVGGVRSRWKPKVLYFVMFLNFKIFNGMEGGEMMWNS